MEAIIGLAVIGSAVWMGVDSSNLMRDIPEDARKQISSLAPSPAVWVVGALFLWIVAFPLYLMTRSKYVQYHQSQESDMDTDRQPERCPACRKYHEGKPAFCPNCGHKLTSG